MKALLPADLKLFKSLVDARLVEIQANKSALHMKPQRDADDARMLNAYQVFENMYVGVQTRIIMQQRIDDPKKSDVPAHLLASKTVEP